MRFLIQHKLKCPSLHIRHQSNWFLSTLLDDMDDYRNSNATINELNKTILGVQKSNCLDNKPKIFTESFPQKETANDFAGQPILTLFQILKDSSVDFIAKNLVLVRRAKSVCKRLPCVKTAVYAYQSHERFWCSNVSTFGNWCRLSRFSHVLLQSSDHSYSFIYDAGYQAQKRMFSIAVHLVCLVKPQGHQQEHENSVILFVFYLVCR